MTQTADPLPPVLRLSTAIGTRAWAIAGAGGLCVLVAVLLADLPLAATLGAAGAGVALAGLVVLVVQRLAAADEAAAVRLIAASAGESERPAALTDAAGRTIWRNAAFAARLGGAARQTPLAEALSGIFAAPDRVAADLIARAAMGGDAGGDAATAASSGWTVAVRAAGGGRFVWRLDKADAPPADRGGEAVPSPRAANEGTSSGAVARSDVGARETVPAPAASLLAALPLATLRISPDGLVTDANAKARRLFGRDTLTDIPVPRLLEGLGRPVGEWIRDAAAGRYLDRTEVLKVSGLSPDRYLQVTLGRLEGDGEAAILAVLSDVTELKSLEAQFVQNQKMQAVGQLAGGIAHDFNNLLTAIGGHCDLLLLHRDEADPDYADLQQIRHNANRAAALVGQLLAFSRRQPMTPDTVDVRNAMSDVGHLLNRLVGEKVRLVLDHGEDLAAIRADKRQIDQVMMNLVLNARDAMPKGGTVRIETRRVRLDSLLVRDRAELPPGDWMTISVRDEGTGIAEDHLKKIFEPFFTTKKVGEGTGLGLSTVYGIVKQSGGFVFADSRLGEGTCFTLWFPAHTAAAEADAAEPVPAALPAPTLSGSVLLVEDEAPVRAFAARALRLRGLTVHEAGSGEEALEMLAEPDFDVDLFVTDVIMPGLDGPAWVSEAMKTRPHARVVFISGYAEEGLAVRRDEIRSSVFLPKPFTLAQLTETVTGELAADAADRAGRDTATAPALPADGAADDPRADDAGKGHAAAVDAGVDGAEPAYGPGTATPSDAVARALRTDRARVTH